MLMIPPTIIPSVIAEIVKYASTIGPMIAKYAPTVLETVGKNLPKIIQTVEALSAIADVLRSGESAEDLGAKAMKADKKPEDFDEINGILVESGSDQALRRLRRLLLDRGGP